MKTCFPVLILSCLLNAFAGSAQTDSLAIKKDSTRANRHSFVKAGLGFVSNNIYLGRKDIATQSGIVPSLGYYHKSGLFVAAAASYIPNTGYQRFDMKMISAGFEHDGEKFSWSAAVSKYAFNDSAYKSFSFLEIELTLSNRFSKEAFVDLFCCLICAQVLICRVKK